MSSPRKPSWLIKSFPSSGKSHALKKRLRELRLHTVCESASCPNIHECFSRSTATFMILGDVCTRACGFCGVNKGAPLPVDREEPHRVARMAGELRLKHVVITSVTRDDLPDGGASHYADTISMLRQRTQATIEILVPDFFPETCLRPDVFNHNIETVPRLYPAVRPSSDYNRSLDLLKRAKERNPALITKSGIMLGLGESHEEVIEALKDLRAAGCDVATIGQYLQPGKSQRPVAAYVPPERFEEYREIGEGMGFLHVASGPFVRSSFNAGVIFLKRTKKNPGVSSQNK